MIIADEAYISALIHHSHPFELDWIGFIGIPLADVDVLILIDAHIMTVLENGLLLNHQLQLSFLIGGRRSPRIGDHVVVLIQDGHKSGIIGLIEIF